MSKFDFTEMAREAKAEADAKQAEKEQAAADARAADDRRLERAEAHLNDVVRPLAEQAKSAFEQHGIGVQIDQARSFPTAQPSARKMIAFLSFRCFSVDDPNGFKKEGSTKARVRFEHDGERLSIHPEWAPYGRVGAQAEPDADTIANVMGNAMRWHLQEETKGKS